MKLPRYPSRRGFLTHALGGAFSAMSLLEQSVFRAAAARAQSSTAASTLFDLEHVAEDTWLALARPAAILNCNAAIFVGRDGVMVVDTHSKPSAAASLIAQIQRQITRKPVRWVVNTHFHYDHAQGTAAYLRSSPKPEVIASRLTGSLLNEHGRPRVTAAIEAARRNAEQARRRLSEAGTQPDREYWSRLAAELEAFIAEIRDWEPVLPAVTFTDDLTIDIGGRKLRMVFRGRAHTASDICVLCERTGVIATGDLIAGFIPGMGDGFPAEWPATLGKLAPLPFRAILPGHGPLQPNRERLTQLRSYIEELNERAGKLRREGRTQAETERLITPASLSSLSTGGYGAFIAESLKRFTLHPPGWRVEDAIATAVRANVAAAWGAPG
jgi:cyclase